MMATQVPVLGGTGPKRGGRQGAGQSAVPGSRYWMYPPCPSVGQGGPTNGLPQPCPKAHPLSLAEATGRIAENQSPATDHCIPGHNLNFLQMTIHIYKCRNVSERRHLSKVPANSSLLSVISFLRDLPLRHTIFVRYIRYKGFL